MWVEKRLFQANILGGLTSSVFEKAGNKLLDVYYLTFIYHDDLMGSSLLSLIFKDNCKNSDAKNNS